MRATGRRLVRALVARGASLQEQGSYEAAARVLRRAVATADRAFGADAIELVPPLNGLGVCYKYLGRYLDAGLLYQRALRIAVRELGPADPDIATIYHNLGGLEHAAGNGMRGEPFARKAVRIRARALGARHPLVATELTALAALLAQQQKYDEAERLNARALAILRRAHGPRHHLVAVALNNLAAVYQARGRTAAADTLYRTAIDIDSEVLGPEHPKIGVALNNLAVLVGRRRPAAAAALFGRALAIFRRALGPSHPHVGRCLENFAPVLKRLGHLSEAQAAARRAAWLLGQVEAVNAEGVGLTGTINPDQARFDLLVQASAIHRLGVFAGEPIPAHRKVIEYTGERISRAEGVRRWDPKRSYLFSVGPYWQIDGAIGGSGAEYINHSCEPNLRARLVQGHILYVSRRAIERGEELTVDYQYAHDTDQMPCTCGAGTCRGVMNLSRREAQARRAVRRKRLARRSTSRL